MVPKRVLMAVVLGILVLGEFAPSAHALFGRHKGNQPRVLHRVKKNSSPYAYLKPKKQKKAKGWYRSTLTGQVVYGKPPKK
jgi:hypothetical protein